jgi:transcriptional regulator with PAS, ATPase and Fis domain
MRAIRSLLWVGSGRGLTESGMTEAPELDVTWVPSVDDALLLPPVQFDGLLYESTHPDGLDAILSGLERYATRESMIVSLPKRFAEHANGLMTLRIGAMIVVDHETPGGGFVTELNEVLDQLHDQRRRSDRTRPPNAVSSDTTQASPTEPESSLSGHPSSRVVALSRTMQEVYRLVDIAAASPSTALILGETGVGKEVVARELHARSPRKDQAFIAINCAAFPESLLESELFGHTKGAFTGADRAKPGLFLAAEKGTLFLDEIAETSLSLQAKLLRVLQEREVRPVGGTRSVPIDCRIVAATNRSLTDEVSAGHFREDLFYRLNVFPIHIPPLRERRRDVIPLARHFLALHGPREGKTSCHISLATGHLLEGYSWPGNVRELENEILRALMLTPSGQLITPRNLSSKLVEILEPVAHGARPDETLREALDRVESWMIRRALANNQGRKSRTAQRLGLTREGLYKKIKRLGLE